jgi:riboflavin synthase
MFSGIVESLGKILSITIKEDCKQFTIQPVEAFPQLSLGESIAINGVCLTVEAFDETSFSVTAVPETLRITNLKQLQVLQWVNLERAVTLNSRIGGHLIQGHIDATATILEINTVGEAMLVKFGIPPHLSKYIVNKGFIALDGMSITVIEATKSWFTTTFIPHTRLITIVKNYYIGRLINLEVDMLGKYVEKLLGVYSYANTH